MLRITDLPHLLQEAFPAAAAFHRRMTNRLSRWGRAVSPGPRAWRGATGGLVLGTSWVVLSVALHNGFLPRPTAGKLLALGGMIAAALGAGVATLVGAWVLRKLPRGYRWALVLSAGLLLPTVGGLGDGIWAMLYFVTATSAVGAGFWVVSRGGMSDAPYLHRAIALAGLAAGVAASIGALGWFYSRGMEPVEIRNAAAESPFPPAHLTAPDPSLPGSHGVLQVNYGSGEDQQRPEFGRDADLIT